MNVFCIHVKCMYLFAYQISFKAAYVRMSLTWETALRAAGLEEEQSAPTELQKSQEVN